MNSLSATGLLPKYQLLHCGHRFKPRRPSAIFSTLKSSSSTVNDYEVDEALRTFLREREISGDFIAKISDGIWLRGVDSNSKDSEEFDKIDGNEKFRVLDILDEENDGGFLKLKRTSEWLLGDDQNAPMNKKMTSKEVRDDRDKRRRLNFLRYEALKRELLFLTVGIGTACTGYCVIALSTQAAVSYATGVFFSCLYFQLLCGHADNMSRESIPEVFTKRKTKKIGIRSEDLQDLFEKTVKGSSIALSSPRLVIPAAIYGLWEISQHVGNGIFNFELVPAMLGLFAYKAAALVQVYRDNEDLQLIFPDDDNQD